MSKCPNCSAENSDTQHFCGDCGTPLPLDAHQTQSYPEATKASLGQVAELEMGTLFAKRYQVIEKLGTGGMGRVYRVADTTLGEEVALKLIRPQIAAQKATLARFKTELKLAREVVHKNVARMFDFNEEGRVPYITMEYVRGENLKLLVRKVGRLFAGQAIPIACQICEGLAEAHRLGIVHRDLKPQNVMIDDDGQTKILDFGLARLSTSDEMADKRGPEGTPAYISPEQIQGQPPDARADLYSLGVLLYEVLTGTLPFKADSARELLHKHQTEVPRDPRELNPGISPGLSQVVMKCLEKDPGARYQTAAEVQEALNCLRGPTVPHPHKWITWMITAGAFAIAAIAAWIFIPPGPWKSSLAVLPIEVLGAEENHQSLFAGLQSEVTDRLSSIRGLRIPPILSVNSVDIKGKNSPQIGKMLGVKNLLKLTLNVEGDTVAAKIYLISAKQNAHAPPLTYSGNLINYRDLQDKISIYTARALGIAFDEEQLRKIGKRGTDNIEAYSSYLEGMKLIETAIGEEDINKAIEKYRRAIDIDPNYALAAWGLGNAYESLYYSRQENKDPVALERMYEYFNRASQMDSSFAETDLGLGWYYFNKGDNPRAFDSFRKALALEPEKYIINRDAGAFLRSVGLYKQAIPFLTKALKISAHESLPFLQIAQCWLYLGDFDRALSYAEKAIAVQGNDPDSCIMHACMLTLTKKLDEADREIRALRNIDLPETVLPKLRFLQELSAALRSDKRMADPFRDERPSHNPQGTYAYLLLDMKDEAIANIEAGIKLGFSDGMYLYSYPSLIGNPWYKALRDDARFQTILKKQKEFYVKELKPLEKL